MRSLIAGTWSTMSLVRWLVFPDRPLPSSGFNPSSVLPLNRAYSHHLSSSVFRTYKLNTEGCKYSLSISMSVYCKVYPWASKPLNKPIDMYANTLNRSSQQAQMQQLYVCMRKESITASNKMYVQSCGEKESGQNRSSSGRHRQALQYLSLGWRCTQRSGDRRASSCWYIAPIVRHVCPDKMTGSKGTAETQLTGQYAGRDDTGELPSIVPGMCWVCASNAEKVQAGTLGLQNCAAAYSTNFDRGHGYRDLQVAVEADQC